MKNLVYLCFMTCLMALTACSDSDKGSSEMLKLEPGEFTVDAEEHALTTVVSCEGSWQAKSSSDVWCKIQNAAGTGGESLKINVEANVSTQERTAVLTVTAGKKNLQLRLTQQGRTEGQSYEYKIPLVFQVLYTDENDPLQNVSAARLNHILEKVNENYRQNQTGLQFVLATTAPDGSILPEPGINRVKWTGSYPIDYNLFMTGNNSEYLYLTWDQNEYVNVLLYQMSKSSILGVSHFPYGRQSYPLDGLKSQSSYIAASQLLYPHCVSINSTYINNESVYFFDLSDIVVTLTHELGHYFGLFHVFSEPREGQPACADTDYCADTPTYIADEYHSWLLQYKFDHRNEEIPLEKLSERHACDGTVFISTNYMDYDYALYQDFTNDQRQRIDYVLHYSPLIPGPKVGDGIDTRVAPDNGGKLDLPVRFIVCSLPQSTADAN